MIESWRVGYGCDASSPPDAPPGATIATTAATAKHRADDGPRTESSSILKTHVPAKAHTTILARRVQVLRRSLPPASPCS